MPSHLIIMHKKQRGFSFITLIIGFLLGLLVAAGVSFYINNAKVPFIEHFSSQEQPSVPSDWNPNASLEHGTTTVGTGTPPPLSSTQRPPTGNVSADPAAPAVAGQTTVPPAGTQNTAPAQASTQQFFVQAGTFTNLQNAEELRARLALLGIQATISKGTAAGQTVHRVRIGPYSSKDDAKAAAQRLTSNGVQATVVEG